VSALDGYVEDGRFSRERPDEPSRVEPAVHTISVSGIDPTAGMDACLIDTDVQVTRNPDGTEVVTDSEPVSLNVVYTFERIEGTWYVVSFVLDQQYDNQVGCG
jgi:hypothetical protein